MSFNRFSTAFEKMLSQGSDTLDGLLSSEVHKIAVTGLSRSGKSMLFTSLMLQLKQRTTPNKVYALPLLKSLPLDLVEKVDILPLNNGIKNFPFQTHLQSLEQHQWPKATDEVYGFELKITLKEQRFLKKIISKHQNIVFQFYDYPGEWLTDLPMYSQAYIEWSHQTWTQLSSLPQKHYAQDWLQFIDTFDFDIAPTDESVTLLVNAYRAFLLTAKKNGITLLQPGSLILQNTSFNWVTDGFAPLPSKVTCDPHHPWLKRFNKGFKTFQNTWLKTLKTRYFEGNEKQIILIDLFEGLAHSKAHLEQLKETLSRLSEHFVYARRSWFAKQVLRQKSIAKVAFVATKIDRLPEALQPNLKCLLKDITSGIRSQFKDDIDFKHFLVSAIQATDAAKSPNSLRYRNPQGDYVEATFEAIPTAIKDISQQTCFPLLPVAIPPVPPDDLLARILDAPGLDRLFEYLLNTQDETEI